MLRRVLHPVTYVADTHEDLIGLDCAEPVVVYIKDEDIFWVAAGGSGAPEVVEFSGSAARKMFATGGG